MRCSSKLLLIGAKNGPYLESKARLLGGVVLILIGFKILLF
nr:manganese efflux pump [uncultured Glaciecola sp.]